MARTYCRRSFTSAEKNNPFCRKEKKINTSVTTELIRRAANGEKLTREEKEALNRFELAETQSAGSGQFHQLASENTLLKEALKRAQGECEDAKKQLENWSFERKVETLAQKHLFADSQYLGFLVRQKGLSLDEDEAVDEFISGLKESKGSLFKVALPDSSSIAPLSGNYPAANPGKSCRESLTEMLELAPEA